MFHRDTSSDEIFTREQSQKRATDALANRPVRDQLPFVDRLLSQQVDHPHEISSLHSCVKVLGTISVGTEPYNWEEDPGTAIDDERLGSNQEVVVDCADRFHTKRILRG